MKRNRLQVFFGVSAAVGAVFFAVSAVLAAPEANRSPQAEPMRAQLFAPVTYFSVVAMDPDNDPLTYSWQGDIACGIFNASNGPTASWSHPNGNPPSGCPHDQGTSHPGVITVQISDGRDHAVVCTYEGSESGNGPLCSGVSSFGGTSMPRSYSYNDDSYRNGDGWIVILVAVAFLWWWIKTNKLFVKDENHSSVGIQEAEHIKKFDNSHNNNL